MSDLERQVQEYLYETLGVSVNPVLWDGVATLPAFLTVKYRFARASLMRRKLLLVIDESRDQEPPSIIRKHLAQVQAKWPSTVVYVRDQVTAYNRKRLIEQRVPFVVPRNQMYLPEFGIDLREYFRTPPPNKRRLRPATQAVLFFVLLNKAVQEITSARLAPLLGYTTMTLSRAFDELESTELAESDSVGRERILRLRSGRQEIWERAQPWLVDPVKSRHFVKARKHSQKELRAGQDALARYSMITEPRKPVIAISRERWPSFKLVHPHEEHQDRENATAEIEVWKYTPRESRIPGVVEPLSLYLSLRQTTDERLEQALSELMRQVQW